MVENLSDVFMWYLGQARPVCGLGTDWTRYKGAAWPLQFVTIDNLSIIDIIDNEMKDDIDDLLILDVE